MSGTNDETAPVEPSPHSLESLTQEQLAELGTNSEMLASVRAEVCRRLKNCPNKANCLTFRWLHAMVCGANRAVLRGSIVAETREDIKDALVDCLRGLRTLTPPEVVLRALASGFHTAEDVGNAVRRKVRGEAKLAYGGDAVSKGDGGYLTLFETLPDEPRFETNRYDEAVESIFQEKAQIVDKVGEEGWEVLEQIVELVDNDSLPNTKRDRQRVITKIFETVYGVNARQASTHKRRFQEAFETAAADGKPVFEELLELLEGWN